MSKAQYRSRTWKKKVVRRTGEVRILFKRKRIDRSRCICGRLLTGVCSTGRSTKKKTSRPYGGSLCTKCARRLVIEDARGAE